MANFFRETKDKLNEHEKVPQDVLWIGNNEKSFSWDQFSRTADFEYDHGFGNQRIKGDLVIVGEDWWLERVEYDDSGQWQFKTLPKCPDSHLEKSMYLKPLLKKDLLNKRYCDSCDCDDISY